MSLCQPIIKAFHNNIDTSTNLYNPNYSISLSKKECPVTSLGESYAKKLIKEGTYIKVGNSNEKNV